MLKSNVNLPQCRYFKIYSKFSTNGLARTTVSV